MKEAGTTPIQSLLLLFSHPSQTSELHLLSPSTLLIFPEGLGASMGQVTQVSPLTCTSAYPPLLPPTSTHTHTRTVLVPPVISINISWLTSWPRTSTFKAGRNPILSTSEKREAGRGMGCSDMAN